MTGAQANEAAVERFYQGISEADADMVLSLYAEDCEFLAPEALPWGGTYRGHDGIRDLFATFMSHWREISETPVRIFADEDAVMVLVRMRGITRVGATFERLHAVYFEMRDGKALRGIGFLDTSALQTALGLPVEAA